MTDEELIAMGQRDDWKSLGGPEIAEQWRCFILDEEPSGRMDTFECAFQEPQSGVLGTVARVAVPVLIEIAKTEHRTRAKCLWMLGSALTGVGQFRSQQMSAKRYSEKVVMNPFKPGQRLTRPFPDPKQLAEEHAWVERLRLVVEAGIDTYLAATHSDDPEVRTFAAYALAGIHAHERRGEARARAKELLPEIETAGHWLDQSIHGRTTCDFEASLRSRADLG